MSESAKRWRRYRQRIRMKPKKSFRKMKIKINCEEKIKMIQKIIPENQDSKKNLSEEDKDMIVNEISLVIQNIISFFQPLLQDILCCIQLCF
jgi:hypothetical protein